MSTSIPLLEAEEGRFQAPPPTYSQVNSAKKPASNVGAGKTPSAPPRKGLLFDEVDEFLHGSSVAAAHVSIRMGFLRKVLGLLSLQLLLTVVVASTFMFVPMIKGAVLMMWWVLPVSFVGSLALLVAAMVKRHDYPANLILLFAFTALEALTVGFVVSFYDTLIVLEAVVLTAVVVVALTLYALQTKRDFTSIGAALFSVLLIFVVAGFLQVFLMSPLLEFGLAAGGAALFSLFIVFDLQMLMHRMSPEEYIMATITLYLDIINLFLHILRLLAEMQRR